MKRKAYRLTGITILVMILPSLVAACGQAEELAVTSTPSTATPSPPEPTTLPTEAASTLASHIRNC